MKNDENYPKSFNAHFFHPLCRIPFLLIVESSREHYLLNVMALPSTHSTSSHGLGARAVAVGHL